MATHHNQPLFFAPFFVSLTLISTAFSHQQGFTVDLIHRDSPALSSFSTAASDGHLNPIRRSIVRARRLQSAFSSYAAAARVFPAGYEYVMDISIGTPPTRFLAVVDTGSDLTWIQCKPCANCYKQTLPIFDPNRSSTYKPAPCGSYLCKFLPTQACQSSSCLYNYSYGDNSYTVGKLATEQLNINNHTSVPNFYFGCGHDNDGTFDSSGSGLVGLGQSPLSLIGQTLDVPAFAGKFAYCLVPNDFKANRTTRTKHTGTSKISFGQSAIVSGEGVVSTPLLHLMGVPFYFLSLKGVSVGGKIITMHKQFDQGDKGKASMIIDSGSTLTFLPGDTFRSIVSTLRSAIKAKPVAKQAGLQLCYKNKVDIPNMTFHFDGADLELKPTNTFVELQDGVVCLAMLPAVNLSIFGNLAQTNFLVGYDLNAKKIYFKPTDCTKYV